ncbi:MAG: hypothetical protein OXT71_12575 [Acidobacteriota bacterium]|nr:hypothetical protein [Acidobacteriota bacterium]
MNGRREGTVRFLGRAAVSLVGLQLFGGTGTGLMAQGCAMCKSSAQVLGQFSTLNAGILVLGVPPVMILALFLYLAFRQRP